jgi:hypothetical protein
MQSKVSYKDINQTLKGIHTQVCDSLDYCSNKMPVYSDPINMFYSLRQMVQYHSDPPGTELLQTVPTLFENNYWKMPGAGDCDCFSILILAMCCVHGWHKQRIVLCGRSKRAPVHIFTQVFYNNEWITLDLTRPLHNSHRKYKFYQFLPC